MYKKYTLFAKNDNANPVAAISVPVIVVKRNPILFDRRDTNGPANK